MGERTGEKGKGEMSKRMRPGRGDLSTLSTEDSSSQENDRRFSLSSLSAGSQSRTGWDAGNREREKAKGQGERIE